MRHRSIRIALLLVALATSSLACNFAYDLIEDTTGISLGGEVSPEAPAIIEGPPDDLDAPDQPSDESEPAEPAPEAEAVIPPEVRDQMDEIQEEVVLLRGLRPTGPVDRELLSEEGLREHVVNDFFGDYTVEESQDDVRLFVLLGLLEPGYDLYGLFLDLYSEGLAGFYDPDVKQMFVVQESRFGGPERITYAHEYAHVLQDQIYDIREGLDWSDEACEGDSERCAAIQALIEGDATLLEQRWLITYASDTDFQELIDFYDTYESPAYDSAPHFIQEDWLFPYTTGFDFVEHFFLEGGWAAVDAIYNNPPLSTEQILHPTRYPEDVPITLVVPELLDELGSDWRELDRDVLGEWFTFLVLVEQLPEEQVRPASEGWGGDYYIALRNDFTNQDVLVLTSIWDSVRDAHDFYGAFRDYAGLRFGERTVSSTTRSVWEPPGEWISMDIVGNQTLWILAPNDEIGERFRELIPFPAELAE